MSKTPEEIREEIRAKQPKRDLCVQLSNGDTRPMTIEELQKIGGGISAYKPSKKEDAK